MNNKKMISATIFMLNSLLLYSSVDISSFNIPTIDMSAMNDTILNSSDDITKTFSSFGSSVEKIGASIGAMFTNMQDPCSQYKAGLEKYNSYSAQYQAALTNYTTSNDTYQKNLATYAEAKNQIDPLWSNYDTQVAMYNKNAAAYNAAVEKSGLELDLMPIISNS